MMLVINNNKGVITIIYKLLSHKIVSSTNKKLKLQILTQLRHQIKTTHKIIVYLKSQNRRGNNLKKPVKFNRLKITG